MLPKLIKKKDAKTYSKILTIYISSIKIISNNNKNAPNKYTVQYRAKYSIKTLHSLKNKL